MAILYVPYPVAPNPADFAGILNTLVQGINASLDQVYIDFEAAIKAVVSASEPPTPSAPPPVPGC